jgi:hypothetical protein
LVVALEEIKMAQTAHEQEQHILVTFLPMAAEQAEEAEHLVVMHKEDQEQTAAEQVVIMQILLEVLQMHHLLLELAD